MKICASLLSLLLTLAGCPAWAEDELVTGPDRRHEIDLRIDALDAERAEISTEGPMAATIIGLAALVGGGIAIGVRQRPCNDQFNECGDRAGAIIAGLALFGVGGAMSLAGGIVWGKRVDRRNEIDAERESLIDERDGLAAALSRVELQSPYRNGTRFVTLGVRF
jgi:hypothetical protein